MNTLPVLHSKEWNLIISPPHTRMLIAIAHIAYHAELTILDCGRQFDSSVVARAARGRHDVIDRIKVQRAFTCYEAVKLIERLPGANAPVIVLDFLSTFQDENVKTQSRRYLLEVSIRHFQRVSRGAGLAVSVDSPSPSPDSIHLFERLRAAAPNVSSYESSPQPPGQLRFL